MESRPQTESAPKIEPVEDVIREFKRTADDHRAMLHNDDDCRETFATLHRVLDKFENNVAKRMYDEGRMPTFDSIDRALRDAAEVLKKEGDPDSLRIARLLDGRMQQVKQWCRKYVQSLLKFRSAHQAFLNANEVDQRDMLQAADAERRRIHDALLGTLASLNDALREAGDYAPVPEPAEWTFGNVVPTGTANRANLIFSPEALQNRDGIRDWAIVADRIEEIRKITGINDPAE